jgi:hypothetical protein
MKTHEKGYTDSELISILNDNMIEAEHHPVLIKFYRNCFDELLSDMGQSIKDGSVDYNSVSSDSLSQTTEFAKNYIELISKGHGVDWAYQVAYSLEEFEYATYSAYWNIRFTDPETANKELLIHCKSLGGDSLFEKHYLFLFDVQEEPSKIKQKATEYSKIYKEQRLLGKSEIYAHHYADLIADGEYHEIYCEEYAFAYDNAINQNKSTDYAHVYAEKYGEAIVDIKGRFGNDSDEEAIDFAIERVNAFMHAWVSENPIN